MDVNNTSWLRYGGSSLEVNPDLQQSLEVSPGLQQSGSDQRTVAFVGFVILTVTLGLEATLALTLNIIYMVVIARKNSCNRTIQPLMINITGCSLIIAVSLLLRSFYHVAMVFHGSAVVSVPEGLCNGLEVPLLMAEMLHTISFAVIALCQLLRKDVHHNRWFRNVIRCSLIISWLLSIGYAFCLYYFTPMRRPRVWYCQYMVTIDYSILYSTLSVQLAMHVVSAVLFSVIYYKTRTRVFGMDVNQSQDMAERMTSWNSTVTTKTFIPWALCHAALSAVTMAVSIAFTYRYHDRLDWNGAVLIICLLNVTAVDQCLQPVLIVRANNVLKQHFHDVVRRSRLRFLRHLIDLDFLPCAKRSDCQPEATAAAASLPATDAHYRQLNQLWSRALNLKRSAL